MGVELTKDSVDVGIVVKDAEASLKFYRDTLGLRACSQWTHAMFYIAGHKCRL